MNLNIILILIYLLPPSAFSAKIRISEGSDISYRVVGEGPPLIILNGGPGRKSEHFELLANQVAVLGFQVITFDQRGTGQSTLREISEKTINMSLMVEDLDILRRHLKIEHFKLLGHSFGAIYAMKYAEKFPERVSAMVLSSSPGPDLDWLSTFTDNLYVRLSTQKRLKHKNLLEMFKGCKEDSEIKIHQIEPLLPAYVYNRNLIPIIKTALLDPGPNYCEVNRLVWKDLRRMRFNVKRSFQGYKAKVLILSGRQDLFDASIPLSLKSIFPNSTLKFIEKSSHYPWLDRPQAFFKALADFFAKQ